MAYNAKPWLSRVGLVVVSGMSDAEVAQRGMLIMLDAMRAAYYARHPDMAARAIAWAESQPQDVVTDGDGQLARTIRHLLGGGADRGEREAPGAGSGGVTDGFAGQLTDGSAPDRPSPKPAELRRGTEGDG